VFYVARHETERIAPTIRCGLIHVPAMREQGKKSKIRGMTLSKMVAAVECCIKLLRNRKSRGTL